MKTPKSIAKKLLVLIIALLAVSTVKAQAFLFPTNPPPQVIIAWNASGTPNVTNYFLYYGTGSMQYTNKVALGNVTNTTFTLPVRSVQFFFAVTSQGGGLESQLSNEVSYAAPGPPSAPSMKPIVVLVVQVAPTPSGVFADTGMNWSTNPDAADEFYRLRIAKGFATTATASPPMPGK